MKRALLKFFTFGISLLEVLFVKLLYSSGVSFWYEVGNTQSKPKSELLCGRIFLK